MSIVPEPQSASLGVGDCLNLTLFKTPPESLILFSKHQFSGIKGNFVQRGRVLMKVGNPSLAVWWVKRGRAFPSPSFLWLRNSHAIP